MPITPTVPTPVVSGSPATAASVNTPISQSHTNLIDLRRGEIAFLQLCFGPPAAITLSAGNTLTIGEASYVRMDSNGGAATQDLTAIAGGQDGDILWLCTTSAARVITIKHNAGSNSVFVASKGDIVLDDPSEAVCLIYNANTQRWMCDAGSLAARVQDSTTDQAVSTMIYPRGGATYNNGTLALETMPNGRYRRTIGWIANKGGAFAVGTAAPGVSGTAALNMQNDSTYTTYTNTNAAAPQYGGLFDNAATGYAQTARGHSPTFWAKIITGADLTAVRYFIGLFSNFPVADNMGAFSGIGFRFSTTASDAGWVGICGNGSTVTTSAAIATIAANTVYDFRVRVNSTSGQAFFSVNGGAETIIATNLPAANTPLSMHVSVATLSGTILRPFSFSRAMVEFD